MAEPKATDQPPLPPVRGIRGHQRGHGTHHAPRGSDDPAPARWRWLAIGFAVAALSQSFLPGNFVWFLCALPHEMGHATIGCLLGHPSAPAISLAGEAWSGIGPLRPWLVWLMALGAVGGAYASRHSRPLCIGLAVLAVVIPGLAFTRVADILIAAGGHLGELAFAVYCYHLCWTGGRTDTPQERIACAMAGALIQTSNVRMCFGLLTDAGARAHYAGSGSLGMKNDYLVLAEDLCSCRLQSIALFMLILAVMALPTGLLTGWWHVRRA